VFVVSLQRLVKRADTVQAVGSVSRGDRPEGAWQGQSLAAVTDADVDALLARLPPWHELELPRRHNAQIAKLRDAEEKVRARARDSSCVRSCVLRSCVLRSWFVCSCLRTREVACAHVPLLRAVTRRHVWSRAVPLRQEWEAKYAKHIESGEAPGYIGHLFRKRIMWL
jgi:hypothetical protein